MHKNAKNSKVIQNDTCGKNNAHLAKSYLSYVDFNCISPKINLL